MQTAAYLEIIAIIGVTVASVSGALAGLRKGMDPIGILVLALITSLGGGTLRDILLGSTPVFVLNSPRFILISIAASTLTFFFAPQVVKLNKLLAIFDALALGVFAIFGAQKGWAMETHAAGMIILAAITGAGGGILRDIICREIPLVFQREIYILPCIIGATLFVLLIKYSALGQELSAVFSSSVIIIIRLLAIHYNFRLKLPGKLDPGVLPRDQRRIH